MGVFAWASWNGATYYIDVFGRRFEKELESLKRDVAKLSQSPGIGGQDEGTTPGGSPVGSPSALTGADGTKEGKSTALDLGPAAQEGKAAEAQPSRTEDGEGKKKDE